eukprot:6188666-Pleurochrysis_carterae.AAC.2
MSATQHTPTNGKSYPCRHSPRTTPAGVAQRHRSAPAAYCSATSSPHLPAPWERGRVAHPHG